MTIITGYDLWYTQDQGHSQEWSDHLSKNLSRALATVNFFGGFPDPLGYVPAQSTPDAYPVIIVIPNKYNSLIYAS